MLDFIFSFVLFLLSILLILAYVTCVYFIWSSIGYIYDHDETEAQFTRGEAYIFCKFIFKILLYIIISIVYSFGYLYFEYKFFPIWFFEENPARGSQVLFVIFFTILFSLIGLEVYKINKKPDYPSVFSLFTLPRFKITVAVVLAFAFYTYIEQAIKWLGSDNSYRQAKYYLVAGEPLQFFRELLSKYVHPEFIIMLPLNGMQQILFDQAVQRLPATDAERAAWENRWFHYHYTQTFRVAFQTLPYNSKQRSPKNIALLDGWWASLEDMGTKPFHDNEVKRELYLLTYSRLAGAYYRYRHIYTHRKENIDPVYQVMEDSIYKERIYKLSTWLLSLFNTWNKDAESKNLINKYPEDEALGQMILIRELSNVIRNDIYLRRFRCDDDTVRNYIAVRKQFIEPEGGKPAYLRVRLKRGRVTGDIDSEELYMQAITEQAFTQYLIEHYCGQKVPGKVIHDGCNKRDSETKTPEQCLEDRIRYRKKKAIDILEKEIFHGNK